ncbi:fatty acid desaturase [Pleurocapsa sp. PCC 7327]|uniref:fatty acid desaturase n=1 Tax=Pleurocapsa sp. PCC 7327 TaxID=118163 RepID=UPI000303F999|nr:fatty acid desaturase [Pleurocapsa sp. PCC 7327]
MEGKQTDNRNKLAILGKSLPDPCYKYLQNFLTWVTGKSYSGQKALFISSKNYELTTAIASLLGGVTVSATIFHSSFLLFPLLPISWIVTVGGARKILTCIIHRCVHRQFWGNKSDRILAEILSTLIFVQGFDSYRHDHVKCHHHADKFATFEGDPDAKFMLVLGFYPGLKDERN